MHNPTGSTQPTPNHTTPRPRIAHRLIEGKRETWCGKTLPETIRIPGTTTLEHHPSEICSQCTTARMLDAELTKHLRDTAPLPVAALELLHRLDNEAGEA